MADLLSAPQSGLTYNGDNKLKNNFDNESSTINLKSGDNKLMNESSSINNILDNIIDEFNSNNNWPKDILGKTNSIKISQPQVNNESALSTPKCALVNGIFILKHKRSIYDWTVQDVAHWLEINNFGSYVNLFCTQHRIDGRVLVNLTADDLRSDPLKLTIFGDIKRFCLAFDHLRTIFYHEMVSFNEQNQLQKLQSTLVENSKHLNKLNVKKKFINKSHQQPQPALNSMQNKKYSFNHHSDDDPPSSTESIHGDPDELDNRITAECDEEFELMRLDNNANEYNYNEFIQQRTNSAALPESQLSSNCSSSPSSFTSTSTSMSNSDYMMDVCGGGGNVDDIDPYDEEFNQQKSTKHALHNCRIQTMPTTTGREFSTAISHPRHYCSTATSKMLSSSTHPNKQPQAYAGKRYSSQKHNRIHYRTNQYNVNNNNNNSTNSLNYHHRHHHRHHHHHHHRKDEFKPEAWKAIVAMIYFFSSTWITAIVMVIVHDRVPDMDTYPPLPDLILDNLPLIPWAFSMAETCGLILFIIWTLILIFHKHRFILLRRMFSLFGSVFLIRCFTMVITSLSVPGRHLECKARPYGTWTERLYQAYMIWQGGGMAIQGVRTCGDYMFSGHTVVLTMLNFFVTEYTPTGLYLIHTMSWVLNLFGVFFILAAHEHYSIDVFIAFYITTRLFLYYHTLANNRALYQRDGHRTRIWFPLFSFFESSVNGIVPNEYEIPFRRSINRLIAYLTIKFEQFALFRLLYDTIWDINDNNDDDNDLVVPLTTETNINSNYIKLKTQ